MDRASSHLIQQKNTEDVNLCWGYWRAPQGQSGCLDFIPRCHAKDRCESAGGIQCARNFFGRDMGIAENSEVASREVSFRSGIPRSINRLVWKHRQWMNLKNFVPLTHRKKNTSRVQFHVLTCSWMFKSLIFFFANCSRQPNVFFLFPNGVSLTGFFRWSTAVTGKVPARRARSARCFSFLLTPRISFFMFSSFFHFPFLHFFIFHFSLFLKAFLIVSSFSFFQFFHSIFFFSFFV